MIFSHRTHRSKAALLAALTFPFALLASPRSARAQHDVGHHMGDSAMADDGSMAERAMGDAMKTGPHMRMTALRPSSEGDSRRAADLAATLRRSIAKYQDVKVAEADGYRMFAPRVKKQRIYHYTSRARGLRSAVRFDPAEPTSLLYRKNERGELVLVGAMYTAPRDASEEELDRRVPLSVARWHQHVDICVPKLRELDRWNEMEGGRMRFGPAGAITTRAECDAAGGRFRPQSFGWMVHANVFASDDPAVIWGHGREGMAGKH